MRARARPTGGKEAAPTHRPLSSNIAYYMLLHLLLHLLLGYCICYCKGVLIIYHEVGCSCILPRVDLLRYHFEICWNPLPWDPLSPAQRHHI